MTGWGKHHHWRSVGLSYEAACGEQVVDDGLHYSLTEERPEGYCLQCQAMFMSTSGWTDHGALLQEGLYRNANGFAVVVVAVVNAFIDWTAYIGGCDGRFTTEVDAVLWVARNGAKLEQRHAEHFFPHLPRGLYRA